MFLCLLMVPHQAPAQNENDVQLTHERVAGSVHIIYGTDDEKNFSGGNIALLVGEDGPLMVDSKMAPFTDMIKKAVQTIAGEMPKFIVNTHYHFDHAGGNAAFSGEGTLVAHDHVRKRLMVDQDKENWPVITFGKDMTFHLNGEEIRVEHYPAGHTDGDVVIHFTNANVVHMGDLFLNKVLPVVHFGGGGTVQGYLKNVKTILDKVSPDVKIIPGHGPLASRQDLVTYYRMLTQTVNRVNNARKAGKSLDQIKEAGLQEEWKSWSWRFVSQEKWIETIYKGYTSP